MEGVDVCDLFPWPHFNNYPYGTGIWRSISILAVVSAVVSGVTVWRFDICSNEI